MWGVRDPVSIIAWERARGEREGTNANDDPNRIRGERVLRRCCLIRTIRQRLLTTLSWLRCKLCSVKCLEGLRYFKWFDDGCIWFAKFTYEEQLRVYIN